MVSVCLVNVAEAVPVLEWSKARCLRTVTRGMGQDVLLSMWTGAVEEILPTFLLIKLVAISVMWWNAGNALYSGYRYV